MRARANENFPKQQFPELINSAGKLELQIQEDINKEHGDWEPADIEFFTIYTRVMINGLGQGWIQQSVREAS